MEWEFLILAIATTLIGFAMLFPRIKKNTKQFPLNLTLAGISLIVLNPIAIGLSWDLRMKDQETENRITDTVKTTAEKYSKVINDTTAHYESIIIDTVKKLQQLIVTISNQQMTSEMQTRAEATTHTEDIKGTVKDFGVTAKLTISDTAEEEVTVEGEYATLPPTVWNYGYGDAKDFKYDFLFILQAGKRYLVEDSMHKEYVLPANTSNAPIGIWRIWLGLRQDTLFFMYRFSARNIEPQLLMFYLKYPSRRMINYDYMKNPAIVQILRKKKFIF